MKQNRWEGLHSYRANVLGLGVSCMRLFNVQGYCGLRIEPRKSSTNGSVRHTRNRRDIAESTSVGYRTGFVVVVVVNNGERLRLGDKSCTVESCPRLPSLSAVHGGFSAGRLSARILHPHFHLALTRLHLHVCIQHREDR